jgi:DnaK suppressor protein
MAFPAEVLERAQPAADQTIRRGELRMPVQELADLKRRLREHRRFRRKQLRDLLDSPKPSTPQEHCTAARIEVRAELIAGAVQVLSDIEVALIRIDTGQYGVCQTCGGAIGTERLRIVPYTRYCARCHRAAELGA